MRLVEIRRRRPQDGDIERLARVYVRGPGQPAELDVLATDYREGIEQLIAEGVAAPRGGLVHLADGEAFLDALPVFFHSSRFWAEELGVEEE